MDLYFEEKGRIKRKKKDLFRELRTLQGSSPMRR